MIRVTLTLCLLLTLVSSTNPGVKVIPQYPLKDKTTQVAEKVYLHIDRLLYNSGDDIWFKAYVIDPSNNRLSFNTNNLHVELIAPDSKIIQSRTIRIERGIGKGDFNLPDSVSSGQYRIRAYTNHMRNYGDQFFFLKEISIVNPYYDSQGLNNSAQSIQDKIDISFFPEGGSLVNNVTSTVAFKAVNALGKGCDVTGELYASSGKMILAFKSTHLGMGSFEIRPVSGFQYYAIIKNHFRSAIKVNLPESFPEGFTLSARKIFEKKLLLSINTNQVTFASIMDRDLEILLSSRKLISKTTKIKITSLENKFILPMDDFPDGIIRITLSGVEGLPVCERLFYLQKNNDVRLNISTDKSEYKPREKGTAEISISGDSTFTGAGNFSLSASEERFTENPSAFPRSIASWFLLESDVRGQVEEPSYYFDPDNKNRLQDLDLLLITQGWRDFSWKYDSLSAFKHEIGFTLSGNVKRIINNNPIDGVKINLGLFSPNSTQFFDTKTDNKGSFTFKELDIYGKTEAFISSTGKSERMEGRITIDPFRYPPPVIEELMLISPQLSLLTKDYPSFQQEVIFKINNLKKYRLSDTLNLGEIIVSSKRPESPQEVKVRESRKFYSAPDKELEITPAQENYAGDVFSFISGRIAGVRILRGVNPRSIYFPDDVEIYVRGQFSFDNGIKHGALILLDGYEIDTSNLGSILALPMNIIDRIDVLMASPLYGMRGANGVINIITRTGVRRDPEKLTPNSVYTSVHGFDIPRIFYSPKYENKTARILVPDYRSTIIWEPDIRVEKNKSVKLEYYNADNPAEISMTVEGITEEGIPLTSQIKYKVK
jgi:hypothetical protein